MNSKFVVRACAGLSLAACTLATQLVAQGAARATGAAATPAANAPMEEKQYDLLLKGGFVTDLVSKATVARWVRAESARRWHQDMDRHAGDRAAERGSAPMGPREARPEFKLSRMRALREEAGMKDAQIARLMAFDFGDVMSHDTVARALAEGKYPRSLR